MTHINTPCFILQARVEMERASRDYLCCSAQSRKMDTAFDANVERECFLCHYDLHLSAAGCSCSPDKFACLSHAKQLCGCDWNSRFFLFRYEVSELHTLVDALGGKLSAVHRWGVSNLGLSLTNCINKDKPRESKPVNRTVSQDAKKQVKELINHGISAGDEKKCSLSKEIKTPMLQPSSSKAPKEVEKMANNSAGSTIMPVDPSSQQLPPKPTIVTPASLETCPPQSSAPLAIADQRSQSISHRSTAAGSSSTSYNEISRKISPNPISLPTTTGGQNSISCSSLVSRVKNLSDSSVVLGLHAYTDRLACNISAISSSINDGKGAQVTRPDKLNRESSMEKQESVARLIKSDEKVICDSQTDSVLVTPETNASTMCERDIEMLEKPETNASAMCERDIEMLEKPVVNLAKELVTKVLNEQKEGTCHSTLLKQPLPTVYSQSASHGTNSNGIYNVKEISASISSREESCGPISNVCSPLNPQQFTGLIRANTETEVGKDGSDRVHNLIDKGQSVIVGASCPPNSIDRHNNHSQKGPRMAKVVRRVKCSVEPLEYGVVLSGKLWSTSQTIFPRGKFTFFYLSFLD